MDRFPGYGHWRGVKLLRIRLFFSLVLPLGGCPVADPPTDLEFTAQVEPRAALVGEPVTVTVEVHFPYDVIFAGERLVTDVTLRTLHPSILGVEPGARLEDRYRWFIDSDRQSEQQSYDFICLMEGTAVIEVSVANSSQPPAKLLVQCSSEPRSLSFDDPVGDFIDSISTQAATRTEPHTDLVAVQAATVDSSVVEEQFPCADANVGCGTEAARGPMAHFISVVREPVPEDPDHFLVYSVVARTTPEPDDDWRPRDPFDWDVYQSTDHWWHYTIDGADRTLAASSVGSDQSVSPAATGARVVVQSGRVEFFVPWAELGDGDSVEFRTTTFAAGDSSYPPDDRGGDVPGANPTEPLLRLTR